MDFYSSVAQLYMSGIDFHDLTVDEALRQLLLRVKLPGSSQFIRRILKGTLIVRSPTRFSVPCVTRVCVPCAPCVVQILPWRTTSRTKSRPSASSRMPKAPTSPPTPYSCLTLVPARLHHPVYRRFLLAYSSLCVRVRWCVCVLCGRLCVDLHNPRVSQKMKKNQFQEHFGAMLPGLPREYIDGVYDRIRAVELRVADEDSVSGSPAATSTSAGSNDADTQGKGLKGFFSRFF